MVASTLLGTLTNGDERKRLISNNTYVSKTSNSYGLIAQMVRAHA